VKAASVETAVLGLMTSETLAVRKVCVDPDFLPCKNSGVSIQSAGEIAGISQIQSKRHETALKISPQDTLRFPPKMN
jgi:hypothetical protein